jgi:hypothetical protein
MAEFDELSVRVAADTMDFTQGMDSAERSLNSFDRAALQAAANADIMGDQIDDLSSDAIQAAGAMRAMGSQTESAGDELTQTGLQASAASAGLSQYSASATGASFASSSLSTVLVASLAPALGVVAAAAVPVVAALSGLVTVVGAIFGIGLIGAIGGIATAGRDLTVAFEVMVQLIRDELAPVFNAAQEVMISFIAAFEDVLPALVPAQDVIDELATLFDEFGTTLINLLPAFVELGVTLAREFLPGMIELAENVLPQVPGFLRDLVRVFQRLIPSFREAGRLLVNLAPALLEFGFTALSVVGPALASLTSGLTAALQAFNNLDRGLQSTSLQLATIAPIIAGIATLLGGPVTLALGSVTGAVIAFRQAWVTNFAGIRGIVETFNTQLQRVLPAARAAFNAFVSGLNVDAIIDSLQTFESILGTQLQQTMVALKPVFGDIQQLLQDNQEEFDVIAGAVSGLIQALIGAGQTVLRVLGPAFRTVGIPIIRGFITVLDGAISQVSNLIQLFNALQNRNFSQAGEIVGDIGEVGLETTQELIPDNLQQQRDEAAQAIRVILEEDTDIVQSRIEQGAENVVQQRERRSARLQRRTP